MKRELEFVNGVYVDERQDNRPEWVVGGATILVKDFVNWFDQWRRDNPEAEKLKIETRISGKTGKPYTVRDTYEPKPKAEQPQDNQPREKKDEFDFDL